MPPAPPPYEPMGNTPEEREVDRKRFIRERRMQGIALFIGSVLVLLLFGFCQSP